MVLITHSLRNVYLYNTCRITIHFSVKRYPIKLKHHFNVTIYIGKGTLTKDQHAKCRDIWTTGHFGTLQATVDSINSYR